jgi:hypothetical protein
MTTTTVSTAAKNLKQFIGANIVDGRGFKTLELANEYARLKIAAWGSNLVCVEVERYHGLYIPRFNVYD